MKLEHISIFDIPELVSMARDAHAESKYSHFPFSESRVTETFITHIKQGLAVKVMAANIAGFFLGKTGGFVFTEIPICIETTYYVRPQYRGTRCFYLLIKAFKDWSGERPQMLMPHFGKDNSKTYSAIEKLGFTESGRIHTRSI